MRQATEETATKEEMPRFYAPAAGPSLLRRSVARLRFYLSEEEAYGARFLLAPFFLGIGIAAYFSLEIEPFWALLAALALICSGLIYLCRSCRSLQLGAGFALLICCGALAAKSETMRFATPMLGGNRAVPLVMRILSIEPQGKNGYRLVGETIPALSPRLGRKPFRLRLSAAHLPKGAKLGSGVAGLVFLRSFSGPVRVNSYDFAFQNYFRVISGQGNFAGTPKLVNLPPPAWGQWAELKLAALRGRVTERIKAAIPGERGAVAAALITGERAGIAPATNQALRLSGLAHILSISGLHMAMVAGMALLIFHKILGLFPVLFSRFAPRKIAAFCALAAAAFYLALSGADIAAERSFIMVAVMLGAVMADRKAVSLRNLAVSATTLMLWRPHEIMGPSFQMSFAATAALISAFDAWAVYRGKKRAAEEEAALEAGLPAPRRRAAGGAASKLAQAAKVRLMAPIAGTCLASLVAGAAGGVYSAYHFNNTAPFGLVSNVLALPIMSVLVMPFALIGTVLMPLHLEYLPLQIMGRGIDGIEKVAYWVAGFSPAGNPGFIPPAALACLTAGLVLLIFLRTSLRFAALMPLSLGFAFYAFYPPPLALVAENGRLAAIFGADGAVYVNAARVSRFISQIWQLSYAVKTMIPPSEEGAEAAGKGFVCNAQFCRARLRNGLYLVSAEQAENMAAACRAGDIIFLNFMEAERELRKSETAAACAGKYSITMRDLALFGAAEIRAAPLWLYKRGSKARIRIKWAAGAPARPWNSYRRYSKRARAFPS